MAADQVRVYSVAELERLATDYLTGQFGADVLIPVDEDLLVEKAESITLDVWPKLQANHQILGMVLRDVDSGELFRGRILNAVVDAGRTNRRPKRGE